MKAKIFIRSVVFSIVLMSIGCQKDESMILSQKSENSVQLAQTGITVIAGQWDGDMDSGDINCVPGSICYIEIKSDASVNYDPGIYVGDPLSGKTRFMADEEVIGLIVNSDGSTTTRHTGDLNVSVILSESIDQINNNL